MLLAHRFLSEPAERVLVILHHPHVHAHLAQGRRSERCQRCRRRRRGCPGPRRRGGGVEWRPVPVGQKISLHVQVKLVTVVLAAGHRPENEECKTLIKTPSPLPYFTALLTSLT